MKCMLTHGTDFFRINSFSIWLFIYVKWRTYLENVIKMEIFFLLIALTLFLIRSIQITAQPNYYLLVVESNTWIFSLFAFAHKYLNKGSKQLTYLKEAAYPVYIVHMVFLYLGSYIIFPFNFPVELKYIVLLCFTIIGSVLFYEFIVRRFNIVRPFFGLTKK